MSLNESDIDIKSTIPKKSLKKIPRSPSEEMFMQGPEKTKINTKAMIHDALQALKTRKGVSLYAIKKYIKDKYEVNAEKINYLIKKQIKKGVEDGTIVQMKGTGAAGSFKLVPLKEKKQKKPKKQNISDKSEKPKKKALKEKGVKEKSDKSKTKETKKTVKKQKEADDKEKTKKSVKTKVTIEEKTSKQKMKEKSTKMKKAVKTPAKKRANMMKRKSIGSIIKAPKMKPKVK